MNKEVKDTQAREYQLTINNPAEKNMGHEEIKKILHSFPTIIYWCLCDEIGEQKTPHTHVYFKVRNPIKFSTMKNKFPTAHIEKSLGSAEDNRDYIRKEGKWSDTDKKETNLPETFEEWGELPKSNQGKRSDLEFMYDLVKDGRTNAEILELCPETAIKYVEKLNKLRHVYLTDKFRGQRRLNLKVNYITGKTGAGKSRDILDEYGDENVYRVTDYGHPFDSYQCEQVIVFEEFRSSLRLQDMLNFLDIYPVTLPARYTPKVGCYNTVFVVSNWSFEQQYSELQCNVEQKTTYEAWIRRFNGFVKVYTEDGIIKYSTIQDYLKRNEKFHPVTEDEKTPFDDKEKDTKYEQGEMPFD